MTSAIAPSWRARHAQLVALLDQRGLDALLPRIPATFAWYTGGADNRVNHAESLGIASLLLTRRDERVSTTPRAAQVIQVDQAFAWNPSIAGAKAEETFILTEQGPEVVAGCVDPCGSLTSN
jgi:hypothetical protein